jgi:tRNA dimethylallyltransferase
MQVYRGMDIGTAKPGRESRERLPHHLLDIRDPREQFNVGDFVRLAGEACGEIAGRAALPVIAGGTGFYLKNFILGLPDAPPSDGEVRARLKRELEELGAGVLMEELARLDPVSAARIHPHDTYRLSRALEVCRLTGRPLSSFQVSGKVPADPSAPPGEEAAGPGRPGYRFLIAGLKRSREELYRRVELRCEEMFRRGLREEVEGLFNRGYTPRDPGLRAIGYREFFVDAGGPAGGAGKEGPDYTLSGDTGGVQALIVRNSRRYAKRQETFFAALPRAVEGAGNTVWLSLEGDGEKALDLLRSLVHTFLDNPIV